MILRTAALYLAATFAVWFVAIATGRAETVGYRIAVQACRGADCRELPASLRRWPGQFACQGRADLIQRFGEAPRGRALRARCVPVDGQPSA